MLKLFKSAFLFFMTTPLITPALASLPSYGTPEILARANLQNSYNLPALTFLNSTSPVINNNGDVAFKLMALNGQPTQGLWLKLAAETTGKMIYVAAEDKVVTDPSLNDLGQVTFSVFDDVSSDGVFVYDAKSGVLTTPIKVTNGDFTYFSYPRVLNDGHLIFRSTDKNTEHGYFEFNLLAPNSELTTVTREGLDTFGVKSSYLFRPSINESKQWAFKTRLGKKGEWDENHPDQIIFLTPTQNNSSTAYSAQVIAQAQNATTIAAPYLSFDNSVALSNNGLVAFIATTKEKIRSVILYREGQLKTLAREGENGISELELFPPVVNTQGVVVFRAKNTQGQRSLFVADESSVKRIISEGDDIKTDLGRGRIVNKPNYPGFGGDIGLNDHNEIVFYAILESASDASDWGSAVFKIVPKENAF